MLALSVVAKNNAQKTWAAFPLRFISVGFRDRKYSKRRTTKQRWPKHIYIYIYILFKSSGCGVESSIKLDLE